MPSARDDVRDLFSRLHVLEGNKHVLEKAFQLAKFGRRRVESQRANVVFVQDTERYIDEATFLVPGKITISHVLHFKKVTHKTPAVTSTLISSCLCAGRTLLDSDQDIYGTNVTGHALIESFP